MVTQQRSLLVALLVASLIAPYTKVVYPPSFDNSTSGLRGIVGTVELFFMNDYFFGVRQPTDAGLIVARILVIVLLIAVVCSLVVIFESRRRPVRGMQPWLIVFGIVLILTAGLIYLYVGVMAVYHVWSLKQLD